MRLKRESQALAASGPAPPDILEEYHEITMRDGFQSQIKLCKPTNPSSPGPLIVLYHGGGFIFGSVDQMTPYARTLTRLFGATCVSAAYRLAPDYKFPTAHNDAWDALTWIASNAVLLGANPSKGFIVGGVSAGSNLANVLSHIAKDENLSPRITGQWLLIPPVFSEETVPEQYKAMFVSRQQCAEAPVFGIDTVNASQKLYASDNRSPLFASINRASGPTNLPPAYIQVCGLDPFRDDGLILKRHLEDHGVETRLDLYPGLPHGFWAYFPQLSSSKKALVDSVVGMGWLLGEEITKSTAENYMTHPSGDL
jgi:acetyl esterase/lipase